MKSTSSFLPVREQLLAPSILLVDDEIQIHSSLKLRLGSDYRLTCVSSAREAYPYISRQDLDLCIVDIHMPEVDGLSFIEEARKLDPGLGCVILSAFDSDENLRRTIPLHVFDFVPKPLPDRRNFEGLLPNWIEQTRNRRREIALARESAALYDDLELAKIEREVEQTASEAAREALFQSASHLSTVQALLFTTTAALEQQAKPDLRLIGIQRSLLEARRHLDLASAVTEGFFASAYTDRESSPALLDLCTEHAAAIASRLAKIESRRQTIDHVRIGRDVVASGITGIDFLLLTVPLLVQSLQLATEGTTARISFNLVNRVDAAYRDSRFQSYLWVNRRNAILSCPGVLISVRVNAPALDDNDASDWLRGKTEGQLNVPSRGMVRVIQKSKGLMGVAVRSKADKFEIIVALPTVSS